MFSLRRLFTTTKPIQAPIASFNTTTIMSQSYKLKSITSLQDVPIGGKIEAEVEGIEEGKVLLTNVGGKVSALGNKCTHYGAPMVKGILSSGGRLTCPWHGACFNATSGDIENAPALDALPKFGLEEREGAVYITGKEDAIKGSKRKPNMKINGSISRAAGAEHVVVVGAGSGATATVEALREGGYKGKITMIGSEGYAPIDRTKLSKALIDDPSKIALREGEWFKDGDIDFIKDDQVMGVDFDKKTVSTVSGASHSYTKLVLATGGTPNSLPLPGFKDLENIFLLRTVPHVKSILAAKKGDNKKIVVIGSSFIGMEIANAMAKDNDVTVVGQESAPLERVMGKEVGKIFQKSLEKNGVKFRMDAGVEKALPSNSDSKKVGSVQLKDGTVLEADFVVLGTGVKPQTSYLQDNKSVKLEKDGSLKVSESYAVERLVDVYAIGDIATYPYHGPGGEGSPVRIEHWNVAQNSGRIAAAHITKPNAKPVPHIPVFWSALGQQLRYCGNTVNGYDDVVVKGEPENAKFAAYYTKGETVVAVATMATDPIMSQAASLMLKGNMPSKSELEEGVDIMTISA
ncbi:hypothetical protein BJ878DRAFT_107431 [Calycina marina]|uniref:Rieske domain-containing protein n=1 Tax=Calycina marina TaxID=1763456 RepID=A0A9P7Z258_9HELO|nr:hypothetical protein BJ878DRAFT_107431 [Calycina marina]